MEQRSNEWFEARKGKFTASQISRLLGKKNKDGTLSKATKSSIDTYAFEKAVETVFGLEPELEFMPKDMQRGVELEPYAFKLFSEIISADFLNVTECGFYSDGDHSGASPDGLVGEDAILEIKCPQRNKLCKYIANGEEEINIIYYAQMQMQMMTTGRKLSYFFNYVIIDGVELHHTIKVKRDQEMIDLIKERVIIATEIKNNYICKLKDNKQF